MNAHYRVIVIGGGIVGTSVLYHLAKRGWTDIALIERAELTSGSTWHAAAGFHALNDDPNIAALQAYTIGLYAEIERESGQPVGMHMTGGVSLATTPERWEMLKAERSRFEVMGLETRLVGPDEIVAMCPIVDVDGVIGGLYDRNEGYVDAHGATHAYAGAARKRGATVILRNRVVDLKPLAGGGWRIVSEHGTLTAEHVVNAAGLWARRVGRMVGLELPVVPMQHHYLVTDDVPALAARDHEIASVTDLEGFTYMQPIGKGVLLGVYERDPRHWQVDGAPWDYGMDLLPPDIDRISPELEIGFRRFPALETVGVRRWVNGAFTFTPDGNPLVGPVPGLQNHWVACGCMGGFSQGGAIGLTLANWMVDGDPGADIFGMDVARYGAFASDSKYLEAKTRQFYARRFVISYPNEELPAGRPLKTSPCYDLMAAEGAVFGVSYGMETPQYFATGAAGFVEKPTLRRSNADPFVAAEVKAVRTAAGMFESAVYARYEVTGAAAEAFLDRLLAGRLPAVGRIRLAPMLNAAGRLMGDFTVSRLAADRFWLIGSYYLQEWHLRWFREHLPATGVELRNLSDQWMGFAMSGPRSRAILQRLADADLSNAAIAVPRLPRVRCGGDRRRRRPHLADRRTRLRGQRASRTAAGALSCVARGWPRSRPRLDRQSRARTRCGSKRAMGCGPPNSPRATPRRCRASTVTLPRTRATSSAALRCCRARGEPPPRRLVALEVAAIDAEASPHTAVKAAGKVAGYVTSAAFGHHVGKSLALAYVETAVLNAGSELTVDILCEPRPARALASPAYDPDGVKLRS